MGAIKGLLANHGEKILCGIVAILCLISVAQMLSKNPNEIITKDGKTVVIDTEKIESQIEKVQSRLDSTTVTDEFGVFPEPPDAREIVEKQLQIHSRQVARFSPSWLMYSQPPIRMDWLDGDIVVKPPESDREQPPFDFISITGRPVNWQVHVGPKGILILCEDSPAINWPQPGTVEVALFRKMVGEGKEALTPETRQAFLAQKQGEATTVTEEKDEGGGLFGGFSFGPPPTEEKDEEPAASEDDTGTNEAFPSFGDVPASNKAFIESVRTEEEAANKNIRILAEPGTMLPTAWTTVTKSMHGYDEPFTEEEIQKILVTGKLPLPTERGKDEDEDTAEGAEADDAKKPKAEKIDLFGNLFDEDMPDDAGAEKETIAEEEEVDTDGYSPRYYAWFDTEGLDENLVYRYRMVTISKARDLPPEMKTLKQYILHTPYMEMGDMGGDNDGRYFAHTHEIFTEWLKSEGRKVGAVGMQVTPKKIQFLTVKRRELDEKTGIMVEKTVKTRIPAGLREKETNERTERGKEYIRNSAYSLFTYSGPVLTPVRRRITLQSVAFDNATKEPQDARIIVEAMKEGEVKTQKKTYVMKPPRETRDVRWQDFMLGSIDKIETENGSDPKLKDLIQVYEPVLRKTAAELQEIGNKQEVVSGGEQWDFDTGWGLVDIRQCRVILTRYKDPAKLPEHYRTSSTQVRSYLVIREMNTPEGRLPRYKRVIQRISLPKDPYTMKIEWEPELSDRVVENVSSQLFVGPRDVKWPQFVKMIVAEGEKGGFETPAKRVYNLMSQPVRDLLKEGAKSSLGKEQVEIFLKELNERVIDNRSFIPKGLRGAWRNLSIPPRVDELMGMNRRQLTDIELRLMNRLMLNEIFNGMLRPLDL